MTKSHVPTYSDKNSAPTGAYYGGKRHVLSTWPLLDILADKAIILGVQSLLLEFNGFTVYNVCI